MEDIDERGTLDTNITRKPTGNGWKVTIGRDPRDAENRTEGTCDDKKEEETFSHVLWNLKKRTDIEGHTINTGNGKE